ncbi:MAG TPA: DUF433 domain-containing protein [Chloroflexota bacterium]|nr:DUF433 domain-containing protein [Chloroflexota bacterium]
MPRSRAAADERIVRDPRVMVGKPVVRGTRIPVELVLEQLAFNLDLDDLFGAYPELTRDDVSACLRYAQRAVERERSATNAVGGATRASATSSSG